MQLGHFFWGHMHGWVGDRSMYYPVIFLYRAEMLFLEASAMTGENVEEAFLKCAKCILAKIETGGQLFRTLECLTLFKDVAYSDEVIIN